MQKKETKTIEEQKSQEKQQQQYKIKYIGERFLNNGKERTIAKHQWLLLP